MDFQETRKIECLQTEDRTKKIMCVWTGEVDIRDNQVDSTKAELYAADQCFLALSNSIAILGEFM